LSQFRRHYGNGRCAYCVLADRVNKLLAGRDGAVSTQLRPLVEAFAQVRLPFTAIRWVQASPNAKLLAQIVADGRPLGHDVLDELPPTAGVHYIRQIMVETGVLPRRNEDLERVPAWLDHHLADKPPEHANLVRPFLHWFLLRRARNRAAARRQPTSAGRELRRRVLVALELLAWIDEQGMALEQLRQDDLDRWLDEEKTQRRSRIRYFLKWAADRGLTRSLAIAAIPRQQPADLLGDDERWQLLQRCLDSEAMPIDVRAAGALILLFGLQAQRIRHLCAEHVVAQDDNTYLATGKHPILLPPRLGAIMGELADRPPTRPMIQHGTDAPRWLFPGRVPGQPIDNHSLTNRLNRHGISARPARNGALMALAADLPAAIIADLLGMHINTAIRWVRYAGRDWADYLAARAAEQDKKSGEAGEWCRARRSPLLSVRANCLHANAFRALQDAEPRRTVVILRTAIRRAQGSWTAGRWFQAARPIELALSPALKTPTIGPRNVVAVPAAMRRVGDGWGGMLWRYWGRRACEPCSARCVG